MPPEGPETEAQREVRKAWDTEWNASSAVLAGTLDPINVELSVQPEEGSIQIRKEEDIFEESVTQLESEYWVRISSRTVNSLMFVGIYVCIFETKPCSRGLILAVLSSGAVNYLTT